jgi:hypothetical protein
MERSFLYCYDEMTTRADVMANQILSKAQLARLIRRHVDRELYDGSAVPQGGFAIYGLSDPRDIRHLRYVGQTTLPRRRFMQHLNTAKLWLPEDRPWWVKSPKLRPLYDWIRDLYADELRLPTMVVSAWVSTAADARLAERARIYECLALGLPLLNVETEILGRQIPLV